MIVARRLVTLHQARGVRLLALALVSGVARADAPAGDVTSFAFPGNSEGPSFSLLRVVAALLATLASVVLVAAILRRTPIAKRAAAFGVEHRLSVARGGSVAVVHVEGRRLLLGITPSQINLIAELDDAPAPGTASSSPTGGSPFERLFTGLLRRGREQAQ